MSDLKSISRSIRRHHISRLKKIRQYYWGYGYKSKHSYMNARRLGIVAQTPKPCSCWMCGNPRRYFKHGETIQEQRENQEKFWLDD